MPNIDELISNLRSDDVKILKDTLEQLGALGDEKAVPYLVQMLDTVEGEDLLESLLWTLTRIAPSSTLHRLLKHPNDKIVIEVLDAMGRRREEGSVDEIISFTKHPNGEIRAIAIWALGKITAEKTYKLLIDLLKTDKDPLVRANAAWAIGKFQKIDSLPILRNVKKSENDESVLYNLDEAIELVQERKDLKSQGIKETVYECKNRKDNCSQKETQTESIFDNFIDVKIIICISCKIAKVCQVYLIRKFL